MNLHEIETFVSIAQLGGVTRAAGQLHRSQPAITRRINALAEQLGAPLVERIRTGVVLTEAGRAFLPYAEAVLAALKDGKEAVSVSQGRGQGTVSLALVGTLAGTKLVQHLRRFQTQYRDVRIDLRTANSQEVSDLVRRAEVSLGLRYFDDPSPELVSIRIFEERMVVACASEHRWAGRTVRDAQRLRGERWVSFPPARNRRESFGRALSRQLTMAKLDDAEITPIDSLTAQKRLVEAGFGIALLPESSIQEELSLGTLSLIHVPALRTKLPVFLVHRRNGYLSSAAKALLSTMSGAPLRPREPRSRP
ncbi:MAG: LysR family transcriptional regulator [Acetobacteraceae bacterium]|nr:LysR family transcriptional regulator [Acetobacteraceae bacterium]